jgi:hypothetical protein
MPPALFWGKAPLPQIPAWTAQPQLFMIIIFYFTEYSFTFGWKTQVLSKGIQRIL